MTYFRKWLHKNIFPDVHESVRRSIALDNIHNLREISIGVILVESVILSLFILRNRHSLNLYLESILSVAFCILVSIYVAVHLTRLKRNPEKAAGPLVWENRLLILYFIVLSLWGMVASRRHYIEGSQMITFFIVELVITCFVAMPPKVSFPLLLSVHILFYILIYKVDRAANLNSFNYFAMVFLMWLGTVVRYRTQVKNVTQRLEVERLNRKLDELSKSDPLTGLGNRLAVRNDFPEIKGNDVAVMMSDIDYFKRFNDKMGHETGDLILKEVSRQLKENFPSKSCYRYGGDEFLVIMTNVTAEDFNKRVDKWLLDVQKMQLKGIDVPLRCSAGFITGHPETSQELRDLIHAADQRLYKEKRRHHCHE